jgi:hypothetical protein
MKYLLICIAIAGIALWTSSAPAATRKPASPPPHACALLSGSEAGTIMGGALPEVVKNEKLPSPESGQDHTTSCGYFIKGYRFEGAELPPELGLELQLHAMQTGDAARRFYDNMFAMSNEMKNAPDSPLATSVITPLAISGGSAYLVEQKIEPEPGITFAIATVYFCKGKNFGQLQGWKKGGAVAGEVKDGVTKILSKLP